AFNFERLREAGIGSHYLSMVNEGEPLSAAEAILRGIAPDTLRVRLVNRLQHTYRGVRGQGSGVSEVRNQGPGVGGQVRHSRLTPDPWPLTPGPWDYSIFHAPPSN